MKNTKFIFVTGGVLSSLGKGLATMTFDEEYIRQRRKRQRERPRHVGEGLVDGAQALGKGFAGGFTGGLVAGGVLLGVGPGRSRFARDGGGAGSRFRRGYRVRRFCFVFRRDNTTVLLRSRGN
jgi:hypothetical protein